MKTGSVMLVAAFAVLCGCASTEPLAAGYQAPEPLPVEIFEKFCYDPGPIVDERSLIKDSDSYRVYDVSLEAGLGQLFDDDSPITFEFYEQKAPGPSPVALLLPILNGQKHLMRPFAAHFARSGYAVIIVDTLQRRTLLEDMIEPEPAIRQAVLRHRRVMDWVAAQRDLDSARVGVFGASLGGFNALYLAAFDSRVRAVAAALVGGSLAEVLVASDERRIVEAVTEVKQELSLDDEQLLAYLEGKIETDTLLLAPHVNADRVLMVLAKFDDSVPYQSQLALRDAMGRPEALTLPTGHITAAAYLFYLRTRVKEFFDRKFAEDTDYGVAAVPPGSCEER